MKRSKRLIFDDSNLPVNDLSVKRIEEIEKVAMPLLNEMLDKLSQEQPHLFKSSKK
jgi:hypothetical protein